MSSRVPTTSDPIPTADGDAAAHPRGGRVHCFGVDYEHIRVADRGDLWLTEHGRPFAECLMPANWFEDRYYLKHGQKLPGGTGAVFRLGTKPVGGRSVEVVIKFSRVGQEVPLEIATTFPDRLTAAAALEARFNSPFEEFGLVTEMREARELPGAGRILAQRPLAIYAPDREYTLWKLGRSRSRFTPHEVNLARDQKAFDDEQQAMELDIRREYVLIYSWVEGENAEDMHTGGKLTDEQFEAITPRVIDELGAAGFMVLDNKPKHYIMRRRTGRDELLKRRGKPAYALVDFELLQRTQQGIQLFREKQRSRYWRILHEDQARYEPPASADFPPHLRPVRIFGVDYVFGAAPNGALMWVVGRDPDLFDYFLPDRWRRTPRVKLSAINDVYRTRTRDNIYVIYRRSRVNEKPHVDPLYEAGRRIRAAGYNSPFEEIAIARSLSAAGISTIYPRAIYRTGHQSIKAPYMADNRRVEWYRSTLTPDIPGQLEPQPILSPIHDYYTIWGLWRGLDPMDDYSNTRHWGFIDAEQALEQELLTPAQHRRLVDLTMRRMQELGFAQHVLDSSSLLLKFTADRKDFRKDASGEYEVTLSVNALSAYEAEVLSQDDYRQLIERQAQRMELAGFEPLNLKGHHLLLTVNPDGSLLRDRAGRIACTLCNFELVRMLYCRL